VHANLKPVKENNLSIGADEQRLSSIKMKKIFVFKHIKLLFLLLNNDCNICNLILIEEL